MSVSSGRYAKTLQLMLERSQRRIGASSPELARHPMSSAFTSNPHEAEQERYSRQDNTSMPESFQHITHAGIDPAGHSYYGDYEGNNYPFYQMPLWQTDQSFGGANLMQNGLEAFVMPAEDYYQHNNVYGTSY